MSWLLDRVLGSKVQRETDLYLSDLTRWPTVSARKNASELLERLHAKPGEKVKLGETMWGKTVVVPVEDILRSHSLITGGTGSGKTMLALLIIRAILETPPQSRNVGFGLVDPKGDLFSGTLFLLAKRLEDLGRHNPDAARELRRRIVIYDFSSPDPLSSYNILSRWPDAEPDFFAGSRSDLLLDLLSGTDKLSLASSSLLQKLILLLSEFGLPLVPYLDETLQDEALRSELLAKCANPGVRAYFAKQFPAVPNASIAALRRRMEALFCSDGVRLALAGDRAPDFRRFQDEGKVVLVNCFGRNIPRGVRRLLQGLVISDIRQSVFARKEKDRAFLWFCDEAQNFFITEKLRDNMSDLLTMSRSFGSHFVFLTQNLSTAVPDARMLKTLYTNVRWAFSMRREPADCAFLKPALSATGRMLRPQADPFSQKSFYTLAEEKTLALEGLSQLPDRVGYLWLRTGGSEAIKLKTEDLEMPQGTTLEQIIRSIQRDPSIGLRHSRKEYERLIAERDRKWLVDAGESSDEGGMKEVLEKAYRGTRGGES